MMGVVIHLGFYLFLFIFFFLLNHSAVHLLVLSYFYKVLFDCNGRRLGYSIHRGETIAAANNNAAGVVV
jgi:hypothetical protein